MDESAQEFSKRELKKQHKEDEKNKEKRASMGKNVAIILAIFGVIAAFGYGLVKLSDPNTSFAPPLSEAVQSEDHILGNEEAVVTLLEYGDYQCPTCAFFSPIVSQALSNFDGELRFVYRHFPLTGHDNARPAAYAAEAASNQGKFWEMNELLYSRQGEWDRLPDPNSKFEEYAETLGLNMDQFRTDRDSDAVKNKVESDFQSGMDSQVNGTPTFYINGTRVERLPSSPQAFFNLIQAEIDKQAQ